MADKIVINEAYIKERIKTFSTYDDESYNRMNNFDWGSGVRANLATETRMGTGAEHFTPGQDLFAAAEGVRSNFYDRMTQFNGQVGNLHTGLQSLLDTQEEVQSLNKMSAEEFGYYVESYSGTGGTTGQGGPAA
jgi:hypothetical protein